MARLEKTLFGGYSKESVDRVLKEKKEEIRALEEQNVELQGFLEKYLVKEHSISEALVDAKRISNEMLVESETKSEELLRTTEKEVEKRVRYTQEQFRQLEKNKQAIINYEEFMKVELKQLLERHLKMIDQLKVGFGDVTHDIDQLLKTSQGAILHTETTFLDFKGDEPTKEESSQGKSDVSYKWSVDDEGHLASIDKSEE